MARQAQILLVVIGLLANQAVVFCGHAHSSHGDQSTQRAHIHLHGHSHSHGGHHHGEWDHHEHVAPTGNSVDPAISSSTAHDADAIYLGEQNQLVLDAGQTLAKKSPCFLSIPDSAVNGTSRVKVRIPERSTGRVAFARALYLQTSRLLL